MLGMLLMLLVVLLIIWANTTENFTDDLSVEKRKNILGYLNLTSVRSPAGTWSTEENNAFVGLQAIVTRNKSDLLAVYQAQQMLKGLNLWTGSVDGVWTDAFTTAVTAYTSNFDPVLVKILSQLQ